MFPGKVRPEKVTLEYLRSKESEEDRKNTKEWELLQNPTVNLERAKRELIDVEDNLADRRTVLQEQRKNLDAQWIDLEVKELGLQQNFYYFNKFVKENKSKSLRAREKLNQSLEFYEETMHKADEINAKLADKSEIKEIMDRAIRAHKIYENFLYQMLDPMYGFKTIDDIINRYESYSEVKHQVTIRHTDALDQLQNARANCNKVIEYYTDLLIGLHTKVASCGTRFDEAVLKSRKWEAVINNIKNAILEQFQHVQVLRLSIWYTYKNICNKKNIPVELKESNVEGQLLFIKKALVELKRVRIRVKKAMAKEKRK